MKSLSRNFTYLICGSLLLANAAFSQVVAAADASEQNAPAAEAAPVTRKRAVTLARFAPMQDQPKRH